MWIPQDSYSGCSLFITGNCSNSMDNLPSVSFGIVSVLYPKEIDLVFAGIQGDSRGQIKDQLSLAPVK